MKDNNQHARGRLETGRRALALVAIAGSALSVASTASAVTRVRLSLRANDFTTIPEIDINAQGSSIVVGNIEGGQIWPTNIAFGPRVIKLWWPADDSFNAPNASVARGVFYSAHATAAASAMAGRMDPIPNAPPGIFPNTIIGFAPDARVVLSAGFATGFNSEGLFLGDTENSRAFAIFSMTDPLIANFAANLLGIDPYDVATVVNASFGSVTTRNDRLGETILAHAFDATVWRNDTVIVVAAGDEDQNQALQDMIDTDPMDPSGTVSGPGTAWNVLTVGRLDQNGSTAAMESGSGQIGVVDWRFSGITMLSSIDPQNFLTPCVAPGSLTEQITMTRSAVGIAAPGSMLTLASRIQFPDPSIDPLGDNSFGAQMWTGTSFSSAIVAGAAAMVQDIGNKRGLWPVDANGVSRPSGLATRAILLNSADQSTASVSVMMVNNLMGAETNACIFAKSFDDKIGLGVVSPKRIRTQMIGKGVTGLQVDDVRSDNPMVVDGLVRPLLGFTRGNFTTDPTDPHDFFRDPPPTPNATNGGDIGSLINSMNPPPAQDFPNEWSTVWTAGAVPAEGTDMNTPFVTVVSAPSDGGLGGVMAPDAPDPDLGGSSPMTPMAPESNAAPPPSAPKKQKATPGVSHYKPYGQPGGGLVGPPDPDLRNDRFSFGSSGLGPVPGGGPSTGGGGGGGGGQNFGQQIKSGWDIGRMGVGFIDYPVGLITPMSTIHATLVWNRTEIWDDQDLASWASPISFKHLQVKKIRPVLSLPENDPTNAFQNGAPPVLSPDGRELPTIQKAFALENLDLELWRQAGGGNPNIIIAASRQEWSDMEHFSVGTGASCDPSMNNAITFGNYFIRVSFKNELFDLGGYRYCGGIQSLQMISDAVNNGLSDGHTYKNMYPGEVPFAIAWMIELGNSSALNLMQQTGVPPRDINGDGVVNEQDVNAMALATLGDLNADHLIDAADLSILLTKFGSDDLLYDLNRDGTINGGDLAQLLVSFGSTPILN